MTPYNKEWLPKPPGLEHLTCDQIDELIFLEKLAKLNDSEKIVFLMKEIHKLNKRVEDLEYKVRSKI